MTLEEYEAALPAGKKAAVPISGNGYAYFKPPTAQQWDEMQALMGDDDAAGDEKRIAYRRMVYACFLGAYIPTKGEVSLDEVCDIEGPAFITGAAGTACNKLAGAGKRPTRFL